MLFAIGRTLDGLPRKTRIVGVLHLSTIIHALAVVDKLLDDLAMFLFENKEDLFKQEFIESEILEQFIPEAPKEGDVIAYLESRWPISRSKMDFPMYQNACIEHFGQKVEPAIIFKFITNNY